jgi:hypothetical protein
VTWTAFASGGSTALQARQCDPGSISVPQPDETLFRSHRRGVVQACNPYGFISPQQDYPPFKRVPEAGIPDNRVELKHVAPQILDSMFNESLPADTPGLLVSLDFNRVENGLVMDSSTWLPAQCTACGACPPLLEVLQREWVKRQSVLMRGVVQVRRCALGAKRSACLTNARTLTWTASRTTGWRT